MYLTSSVGRVGVESSHFTFWVDSSRVTQFLTSQLDLTLTLGVASCVYSISQYSCKNEAIRNCSLHVYSDIMSRKSLWCGKAMEIAITTNITCINKDQNIHTGVYDGSVYYILTRQVVQVESESSTWPTRRVESTLTRDFDSSNSATRPTLLTRNWCCRES